MSDDDRDQATAELTLERRQAIFVGLGVLFGFVNPVSGGGGPPANGYGEGGYDEGGYGK